MDLSKLLKGQGFSNAKGLSLFSLFMFCFIFEEITLLTFMRNNNETKLSTKRITL